MSNFSQAHTINGFDSKSSKAFSGQRLAKVGYKSTKDKTTGKTVPPKFPSVCASIPYIENALIEENASRLVPYIKGMLENAQDGIIRSLYESSDGTLSQVLDSDISIDAIIGFLEAESQGSRLTKEFLEAWYDSNMSETVMALAIEKLKYSGELTPEQELKIAQVSKGYKDIVSSLAGGKTLLQPPVIKQLKNVMELIELDDTGTKLQNKLIAMENKPTIESVLELF